MPRLGRWPVATNEAEATDVVAFLPLCRPRYYTGFDTHHSSPILAQKSLPHQRVAQELGIGVEAGMCGRNKSTSAR